MYARVVAGCAPCRVTQLTLGVTLQRSAAPPFPGGPCVPPGAPYQNTLGAAPQDPLTLKLRLDTNWTFQQMLKSRSVRRRRYALKVPAAHFYVEIVDRVPLPRCGGGGRGKGQMRLRLLLERICAQYGFGFFVQEKSKFVSSTASDRKGVVKGESVPLDRVLPTFARTKVGPRRVGVQMNTFCKTPRRRRRLQAFPCRAGVQAVTPR